MGVKKQLKALEKRLAAVEVAVGISPPPAEEPPPEAMGDPDKK